jgi:hypothetical protein
MGMDVTIELCSKILLSPSITPDICWHVVDGTRRFLVRGG